MTGVPVSGSAATGFARSETRIVTLRPTWVTRQPVVGRITVCMQDMTGSTYRTARRPLH